VSYLGWQKYRGRLIPRAVVETLCEPAVVAVPARLKLGEKIRLRVDDEEQTTFLPGIVADVSVSHSNGVTYALAFPATSKGDFYIVSEGFTGHGMQLHRDESMEDSGIYTELEYEVYLRARHASVARARVNLSLVTAVLAAQDQHSPQDTQSVQADS
jgi:hypothetical protein